MIQHPTYKPITVNESQHGISQLSERIGHKGVSVHSFRRE